MNILMDTIYLDSDIKTKNTILLDIRGKSMKLTDFGWEPKYTIEDIIKELI